MFYLVSASHVSPRYTLTDARVEVRALGGTYGNPLTYYATLAGFGCGKDATTPQRAIHSLLRDNACTGVTISPLPVAPSWEGEEAYLALVPATPDHT